MKHIFISHAGEDSEFASRLEQDLRMAGHETYVDVRLLKLGDDLVQFINEGILKAAAVIIVYSKHTPAAVWQKKEIDAALWHELEQGGGQCYVIRLDDTTLPPLLGVRVFARIEDDNYKRYLEKLCEAILPSETASSVVAEASRLDSLNPFRRVRAEYFDEAPQIMARSFAPPGALEMNALEDMKPCLLEGSRGTGKSMLLLSIRARILASRTDPSKKGIDKVFGFYLKLTRGAVCNAGMSDTFLATVTSEVVGDVVQITDAFSQEIVVCLLESLVSEIIFCIDNGIVSCDRAVSNTLASQIASMIEGIDAGLVIDLPSLHSQLGQLHRLISGYIRRRFIYREVNAVVPVATLDLDLLKSVMGSIKASISGLRSSLFVALLDEYENLFPFQQRVLNSLVKLGPPEFTVKIAKKLGGDETAETTTGQELQEIHDYKRVLLVYDVEDSEQYNAYRKLLGGMIAKILEVPYVDMAKFLPTTTQREGDADARESALAALSKCTVEQFKALSAEKQNEAETYYGEAATYRAIYGRKGRRGEKMFSGFGQISFLSSGVIRYFQEMLAVAYHMRFQDQAPGPKPISLPPNVQSQAAQIVSRHYLTTLSRNVERDGERLKYFLLDLGDCLRHKLLHHGSEPEAGRVTITNPEDLSADLNTDLRHLFSVGIKEGVFQTKEGRPAFKPKHSSDPQPAEFNISRIYAPVLQISPRLRWRSNVSCEDLAMLLKHNNRAAAKKKLMQKLVRVKAAMKDGEQANLL